jgi:Transcriptional regulator PadR-like family
MGAVRTAVREADSQARATRIFTMDDLLAQSVVQPCSYAWLMAVFGFVALTLSARSESSASRPPTVPLRNSCLRAGSRQSTLFSVTEGINMSKPSDLVQGTLDMLLLKILALEPMNGFAVSQRLKQVSGDVLQVSDGSLYPALHKLEQEGWITAEWKTSEKGPPSKILLAYAAGATTA